MGPFVFACQMLQNPLADKAQGFDSDWFRKLPGAAPDAARMNRYIVVDPASAKKKDSDYTSMWVVGLNTDGNYYVLDGIHDRLNLAERARFLFDFHRQYSPRAVGYERYGMQADIEHMAHRRSRRTTASPLWSLAGRCPNLTVSGGLCPCLSRAVFSFRHV